MGSLIDLIGQPGGTYSKSNDELANDNQPTFGASGGGLSGMLSKGLGAVGGISSLVQSLGPVISLITPNKQRIEATKLQEALELSAKQIGDYVNSGQMDPAAAIEALNALQAQAARMGGSPDLAQGAQRAGITIAQVKANVSSGINKSLTSSFNDPNAWGGKATLGGDPAIQKAKLGTGIRNYMLGSDLGNELKGTKLGDTVDRASAGPTNPLDRFDATAAKATTFNPVDLSGFQKKPLQSMIDGGTRY